MRRASSLERKSDREQHATAMESEGGGRREEEEEEGEEEEEEEDCHAGENRTNGEKDVGKPDLEKTLHHLPCRGHTFTVHRYDQIEADCLDKIDYNKLLSQHALPHMYDWRTNDSPSPFRTCCPNG